MHRPWHIIIALLMLCAPFLGTAAHAQGRRYTLHTMRRVFGYAATIDTAGLKARESYAYLKYDIRTNRRNGLLLAIPTMFALANTGDREHVGETYDRVVTTRPGDFTATRLLERNTIPHSTRTMPTLLKYLTPMIYDELIVDSRILSPFHRRNRRFYRYRVSPFAHGVALVSFRPRLKNTKLVRGWARVETATGRVIETAIDGEYDMVRFHVSVTTGAEGVASLLPRECNLNARFLFLGNDITAEYTSVYGLPKTLDDSTRISNRADTALFNRVRPIPLNSHETFLYTRQEARLKTQAADTAKSRNSLASRIWRFAGRRMLTRTRQQFGTRDQGYYRISPIFNPLFFSYSARRGLTYRIDLRGAYYFNTRQAIEARFKAGYSFKQRQFYFDLPLTFYINQRHNAYLRAEWSSGRHITNSEVLDALRSERGDTIDWASLNLTYFRDHSLRVAAHYDPTPKWGVEAGIMAHRRTAIDGSGFEQLGRPKTYTSVAPTVELTFRPTGYNGPILTLDYERCLRGLMGSDMAYERFEADGQYIHRLSGLSSLQMRLGAGFYTQKGDDSYFLDYSNFREENVPGGWNDDWACSFELLGSGWYNASKYYVRANAAYETPLLMLSWLPLAGRLIEKERIYINVLAVQRLHPYIEYGYGFSTRALSVGAFLGQRNWRFDGFNVRVGFELFRHW